MQDESRTEKAFWYSGNGELVFGTLCTTSKPTPSPLSVAEPEVVACSRKPDLPDDWDMKTATLISLDGSAEFCYLFFEVEHGLKFKHPRGGRMPKEILWMLSGWLQRGEFPSYRSYQRYCRLDGLKFLPLLIDHDCFRFFVFRPTVERVEAAVETFKQAVKVMTGPGSWDLSWLATRLLVSLRGDELWPIRSERQDPKLLVNRRRLSFVYRDLKGPQDATRFIPD